MCVVLTNIRNPISYTYTVKMQTAYSFGNRIGLGVCFTSSVGTNQLLNSYQIFVR